jgi:hypothetical protein
MIEFIGQNGDLTLFGGDSKGVIVNTALNMVVEIGDLDVLSMAFKWDTASTSFSNKDIDLAIDAAVELNSKAIVAAASRMYTIPGGAQAEAKKALKWHAEEHRGGTPVGLNTARILAKGGQIGLHKIRHIAKYFPRHEVDKKGKGWEPGEDNFPSNGRIAWALWGGDAGQRWASAIVERENKKALTAGGYELPGYEEYLEPSDFPEAYDPFVDANEFDPENGPEFMIRVRMDGSGIDRLYKVEIDGTVWLWDGSGWDNLGHVDGDVYMYDSEIDDPYDTCEKDHFIIDASSAVIVSAIFKETPYGRISVDAIDEFEARLASDSIGELDMEFIDRVITAAVPTTDVTLPTTKGDGNYTPQERSQNASKQVRDASGKFTAQGDRVVIGGDRANGAGTVTGLDNGKATIKLDNGNTISVDGKFIQNESTFMKDHTMPQPTGAPLDLSGVMGKPRTPEGSTVRLPGTLPPISNADLKQMMTNWPKYVSNMRAGYKPVTPGNVAQWVKQTGQAVKPGGIDLKQINNS